MLSGFATIAPRYKSQIPWIVVGLSFLVYTLRLTTAVQVGVPVDDAEYLVLAESFVTGHPYQVISSPGSPVELVWPPGYPLFFLAPIFAVLGPHYDLYRFTSMALALANILLLYLVLRPHIAEPWLTCSIALFALNPRVAELASLVMSESAFLFVSLVFLLQYQAWLTGPPRFGWRFLALGLTLAIVVLVRYQGLALAAAVFLHLLLLRRPRAAFTLAGAVAILLSPAVWLVAAQVSPVESLFALKLLTNSDPDTKTSVALSVFNYIQAIPAVVVPVFGPTITALLRGFGLHVLVWAGSALVLAVLVLGTVLELGRRSFFAIYVSLYFLMALIVTNRFNEDIFDEPRYVVVVLPFLYVIFFKALGAMRGQFKVSWPSNGAALTLGATLLLIMVAANVNQTLRPFRVADLSAGSAWAHAKTSPRAVFMCPDPVPRYLYLRRKTLALPETSDPEVFIATLRGQSVDYIMVAPPLTQNNVANLNAEVPPWVEKGILPVLRDHPDRFRQVFADPGNKTTIYQNLR